MVPKISRMKILEISLSEPDDRGSARDMLEPIE